MAVNDQMALGVMAGLARLGQPVLGDVSIIGFDDVPLGAMVAPPLTTIRLPTEAGASTVDLPEGDEGAVAVELFGTLVVRDSTGALMGTRSSAAANGAPVAVRVVPVAGEHAFLVPVDAHEGRGGEFGQVPHTCSPTTSATRSNTSWLPSDRPGRRWSRRGSEGTTGQVVGEIVCHLDGLFLLHAVLGHQPG